MVVDLIGLFRGLVRLETELWNRVDAKVQGAHGVPLAWLEVMQIVDTTEGCRVLDVAHALWITVGGTSKVVDRGISRWLAWDLPHRVQARADVPLTVITSRSIAAERSRLQNAAGTMP